MKMKNNEETYDEVFKYFLEQQTLNPNGSILPKGVCLVDSRVCLKMATQSQANKLARPRPGECASWAVQLASGLVESISSPDHSRAK